jgi:hypothetical protein
MNRTIRDREHRTTQTVFNQHCHSGQLLHFQASRGTAAPLSESGPNAVVRCLSASNGFYRIERQDENAA